MSTDIVNQNPNDTFKDTTWNSLAKAAEDRIKTRLSEIRYLKKSIIFFNKQYELGNPYPIKTDKTVTRHEDFILILVEIPAMFVAWQRETRSR